MDDQPSCPRCGIELRGGARFCDACGSQVSTEAIAEFKQVTVLLADVVHSMDVAASVGAERLREILSELFERCAEIIRRYGGIVDKFTGDGVMALFGAPEALEDHAFRACLSALEILRATEQLAADVASRDGVALHVRVGMNSGRVVIGDIGSSSTSYTAIGAQVGLAQRMEAAAPAGGVMVSASTARLVQDRAILGETEMIRIKGSPDPVPARLLLGIGSRPRGRHESALIGREHEIAELTAALDEAICGISNIIEVVGPPGIGKSRLLREIATIAIAFHAVSRLLRTMFHIDGLDEEVARDHTRAELPNALPHDLVLLDDLLGIGSVDAQLPDMDPDARRRRLWRLTTDALKRSGPGLYVVEDAQWIDTASESMLADLIGALRETPAVVLITHRGEYRGALTKISGLKTITLQPLSGQASDALMTELLGSDDSISEFARQIAAHAGGNPFFAEEIVHDFADRGILIGAHGAYVRSGDTSEFNVPVTVQATLSARIDRLSTAAKQTLNAAAVIGSRFEVDLIARIVEEPALEELIQAKLVEPVSPGSSVEYVLRHPLIRTVAYESQLQSTRSELHQRVAAELEQRAPSTADENAALIATHLEAADDLRGAFDWYVRAAHRLIYRDIRAARDAWRRALAVAERLPAQDADRTRLRTEPLTLLCATAWRVGDGIEDTGFGELQAITATTGDTRSLVTAMSGLLITMGFHTQLREASRLASKYVDLLESIGDDALTVGLLHGAVIAKWQAGEVSEALRLAQRVIDLADGDPAMGNAIVGSPLALALAARGAARSSLGLAGWKWDFDAAIEMARGFDPTSRVLTVMFKALSVGNGLLLPEETLLRDTAEVLELAEQSGDDLTLANARMAHGVALIHLDDRTQRRRGFDMLALVRDAAMQGRVTILALWFFDILWATEQIRHDELDSAVQVARRAVDNEMRAGEMVYSGWATSVLVEALVRRQARGDLTEAKAAADTLATVATDTGFALNDVALHRMRALIARARGDRSAWAEHVAHYRSAAHRHGYEGHATIAESMRWAPVPPRGTGRGE